MSLAVAPPVRAIVYIRVSIEKEEMQSPENQRFACETYARQHGIRIVGDPVEDLDLSGRDFAKRQIASVIEQVRRGEADVVLVWKWSRFGRNNYEAQVNIRALEEAGGRLVAVTEDFDTTTSHGKFSRDNMLLIAELQSNMIGDTWREAHANRHRRGLPHTGQARFGYMRCPDCRRKPDASNQYLPCATCHGILVPDPVRGPALKEVYERYVDGEAIAALAREMALRGIRSLQGKVMKASQWQTTMDSGFAAGLIRWRGREMRTKHGRQSKKPSTYDHWEKGLHKPLISMETWEGYRARREGAASIPWSTAAKYSVSGLLQHDECGAKLTAGPTVTSWDGKPSVIFRCPGYGVGQCRGVSVSLRRVEKRVLAWLTEQAKGEDAGLLAMKRAARQARSASEIPGLEQALAARKGESQRLLDLYLKELISEDEFRDKRDELDAEASYLQTRLETLRREAGEAIPTAQDFGQLGTVWPRMEPARRRAALAKVIGRIVIVRTEGRQHTGIEIIPRWRQDASAEGD